MGTLGWRKNRVAKCHPDRKHYSTGFCAECYESRRPKKDQSGLVGKKKYVRHKYGLSVTEYDAIISSSDSCAVCQKPFEDSNMLDPVLDHDHGTGVVREAVHRRCNIAMGLLYDDADTCQAAADYLRKHVKK